MISSTGPSATPATTLPTTSQGTIATNTQSSFTPPDSSPVSSTLRHDTATGTTIPAPNASPPPTPITRPSTSHDDTAHHSFSLVHPLSYHSSQPTGTPSALPQSSTSDNAGLSVGATVGIGVVLGFIILVLATIILWLLRRRRIHYLATDITSVPSAPSAPSRYNVKTSADLPDEKEVSAEQTNQVAKWWYSLPAAERGKSLGCHDIGRAELTPTPAQQEWRELGDTSVKHQLQSTPLYELANGNSPESTEGSKAQPM